MESIQGKTQPYHPPPEDMTREVMTVHDTVKIVRITAIVNRFPGNHITWYESAHLHFNLTPRKLYELFDTAEGQGRIYSRRIGDNNYYFPSWKCPKCEGV